MAGTAETSLDLPLAQPLCGVRVLEFGGTGLAGAIAAHLLAEQGAEVMRIDWPGLIPPSHVLDQYLNRGKTLRPLDLKSREGHAAASGMLRTVDIVIENSIPARWKTLASRPRDAPLPIQH